MRGDWNEARRMIEEDSSLLNAAITKEWGTLLHVVAGTNHVHFANQLVKLLDPPDLELRNFNGNTAFCYAAASGNMEMAAMLIKQNEDLPKIRGGEEATPLYMAVLLRKGEMARHLYPLTTNILEEDDFTMLFFRCIKSELYGEFISLLLPIDSSKFTCFFDKYLPMHINILDHKQSRLKNNTQLVKYHITNYSTFVLVNCV